MSASEVHGPIPRGAVAVAAYGLYQSGADVPHRVDVVIQQGEWRDSGAQWYYGYNSDCFDPTRFLVRADSFEEAYELLTCSPRMVAAIGITDADAADYNMSGADDSELLDPQWNEDGAAIDTEALHLSGPVRVRLIRESEVPAGW